MLIHQRRTLGKMGVVHTQNIDEVKRSTSENINQNTNQHNVPVVENRNVPFGIKKNAKMINFARLEAAVSPSPPPPSAAVDDEIKRQYNNKKMETSKKIMLLPFPPLKTEHTDVFIDSEPNSPKTYKYDVVKPLIEKTISNIMSKVSKPQEIITEETIKPLVEKYLKEFIEEDYKHEFDYEDIPDCATTKFEELIEPAVARIVQRIIKYDYSHDKTSFGDNVSLNLNVDYDEVYDYELQEKGHFERPPPPVKTQSGMYNPMYDSTTETIQPHKNLTANIADIYNDDEEIYNDNFMRCKPPNKTWIPFGNGIDKGNITDIAIDSLHEKMYIVGHFKHVNRTPIENVAVYDKKQNTWCNVGNGVPNIATCVAVHETLQILFVGGLFTKVGKGTGQISAQNIAAYYIQENKWVQLGEGLNRDCNTLILDEHNGKLYAGGTFTRSGDQVLNYIGVYDLNTGSWSSLSGGDVNGPCRTLLKINDQLYIGGIFTHVGHEDIHASYVARYDLQNNKWSDLSGGIQGYCNALAYDSSENVIYIGGTFTSVGYRENSQEAHHVAKYHLDTQTWGTMSGGLNNVVNDLTYDHVGQCLYVGGKFTHTFEDNILVNRICIYDKIQQKWTSLTNNEENDNVGFNGPCNIIKKDANSIVIAGSFQIAGSITANSIVRYLRENDMNAYNII